MRRAFCSVFLIFALTMMAISSYASEPVPAATESTPFSEFISEGTSWVINTDDSDDFSDYFDIGWNSFSLSDSNSVWSQLQFDIPTTVNSVSSLNFQYESMLAKYSLAGYKADYTLEMPTFEFGYSYDLETQFQSAYGGLMQDFSLSASLPEGWSMDSIMSSASQMRSAASSNFLSSDLYTSVMSGISYESPIDKMAALAHTESYKGAVKTKLNELDAKIAPEWNASVSANKESVMAEGEALNHPLITEGVTIEFNVEKQMSELRERANEVAEIEELSDTFENLSQYQLNQVDRLCKDWSEPGKPSMGLIFNYMRYAGDEDLYNDLNEDGAAAKDGSAAVAIVANYIDDNYDTIEAMAMYKIGMAVDGYISRTGNSDLSSDEAKQIIGNNIENGVYRGYYDDMLENGFLDKCKEYYQAGDFSKIHGDSETINSGMNLYMSVSGYVPGEGGD